MPKQTRFKTNYPGVYYIEGTSSEGKSEKIYYIFYRKDGKQIEEKVGRQFKDAMTAAKANAIRGERMTDKGVSNQERRLSQQKQKQAFQDRWTFNRLWEEYKASKTIKGLVSDENRFKNYIQPGFGEKEPREIEHADLESLRRNLSKKHKAATIRNVLELLRRLVHFGVKKNLCPGVGFTIEMPRVNNLKTEDLSPEQLARLVQAIEEDSNLQAATLMKFVLFTGMRRGELFKLKWKDIDYKRGFLWIREPKGGVDQQIPLSSEAQSILENHPRNDSEYVFPGRDGQQRVDITKQVNRIKEKAGLPKNFRALHGLRHVYASMLASSGQVDMYTLQKLLTHKSSQMTQRYAHLRDDALKQASNVIGDAFQQLFSRSTPEDKNLEKTSK